jgi:hypothetical protein
MWPTWFKGSDKTKSGDASDDSTLTPQLRGDMKRVLTIRKREFDKLRGLRKNPAVNHEKPRKIFVNSSMLTDLRDKSSTLKKIDEIEAQMSMQWWKTDTLDLTNKDSV